MGIFQRLLEGLLRKDTMSQYQEKAPQGVVDLNLAQKASPGLYQKFLDEKITGDQLDQILKTGRVQEWTPAQSDSPKEVLGVKAEPEKTVEEFIVENMVGSPMYTNSDETYNWTTAPEYQGLPEQATSFYDTYRYNGNGQFETPLDPQYLQLVWNEIGQQMPDSSINDQVAFLETLLGVGHAESHSGYDAGYIPDRKTNVWNVGYNANPGSVLKYDPSDPREMSDRVVNSLINDFGVVDNKGLTDQVIHNYHIGPNAQYSQPGVDNYRGYIGGWETMYNPTYPWDR